MSKNKSKQFSVCIKNDGYPASLEVRQIYQVLSDAAAASHRLVRVIDESGEDYLYPTDYFVFLVLPDQTAKALAIAV